MVQVYRTVQSSHWAYIHITLWIISKKKRGYTAKWKGGNNHVFADKCHNKVVCVKTVFIFQSWNQIARKRQEKSMLAVLQSSCYIVIKILSLTGSISFLSFLGCPISHNYRNKMVLTDVCERNKDKDKVKTSNNSWPMLCAKNINFDPNSSL